MAGSERRQDAARGVSLGDGDQRNLARVAPGGPRRVLDVGGDGGQIGRDVDGRRAV